MRFTLLLLKIVNWCNWRVLHLKASIEHLIHLSIAPVLIGALIVTLCCATKVNASALTVNTATGIATAADDETTFQAYGDVGTVTISPKTGEIMFRKVPLIATNMVKKPALSLTYGSNKHSSWGYQPPGTNPVNHQRWAIGHNGSKERGYGGITRGGDLWYGTTYAMRSPNDSYAYNRIVFLSVDTTNEQYFLPGLNLVTIASRAIVPIGAGSEYLGCADRKLYYNSRTCTTKAYTEFSWDLSNFDTAKRGTVRIAGGSDGGEKSYLTLGEATQPENYNGEEYRRNLYRMDGGSARVPLSKSMPAVVQGGRSSGGNIFARPGSGMWINAYDSYTAVDVFNNFIIDYGWDKDLYVPSNHVYTPKTVQVPVCEPVVGAEVTSL